MGDLEASRDEGAKRGLAAAIRRHRRGCPPVETARVLLSFDAVSNRLVGVTDGARTVVFLDQAEWSVIEASFDADGPVNGRGVVSESFASRSDFHDWLDGLPRAYWEWIHPRYVQLEPGDG